ncbi:hypothetical protein [Saccharopolyspora taberi]|uniref:PH domain-containing protein n=1 Tax=Saccharopolyspora taberi TaxID=60895 RepID=A0ABN3VBV4_9PSEU
MNSTRAPWPEQWSARPPRAARLVTAAFLVLCAAALAIAIRNQLTNWSSGFRYMLVFALIFAELAVLVFDAKLRPRKAGARPLRTKAADDATMALEMPYSRVQFTLFVLLSLTTAAPFVLGVVGALEIGHPQVGRAVLLGIAALVPLSLPVVMLKGSFAPGKVRLSPAGIHHRGWTHESFLPWGDVAEIRPLHRDGPEIWISGRPGASWRRRQIARIWHEDKLPEVPALRIPGRDLAGDPAVLLALLRHYQDNPASRPELATDRAKQALGA